MLFDYDSKFDNIPSNKKYLIEKTIKTHVNFHFENYSELFKEFHLKNSSFFERYEVAIAITEKGIIQLDCDKFLDYLFLLKKRNGKIIMPDIKIKHNYIYNALHHECCHIMNAVNLKNVFIAIESLNVYSYVKVAINTLLDEYFASYYAQKLFFNKSGAIDELEALCVEANEKSREWYTLFIEIFKALGYAIAENQVLSETKGIHPFNELLNKEAVSKYSLIFKDVQKIITEYSDTEFIKYIHKCEITMLKLLEILEADFELLKAIG